MNNVIDEQTLPNRLDPPRASPWTAPQLIRMRAGDAEVGANPNRPEGPIAIGS